MKKTPARHGGGARRTQPRFSDNSPYLDRRQRAQKVGETMSNAPTPPKSSPHARIVVGVVVDQPAEVLTTAATYAQKFDAELICAHVDDSRYTVDVQSDGSILSMPIDPDTTAEASAEFAPELHTRIASTLDSSAVEWSTRALAGAPAHELSRLAEAIEAQMIIVGVRRTGIKGSLHEFFNGSVAIQLAHHQIRPVVVVPLRSEPVAIGTTGEAEAGTGK
ncbi:universal stress protein [Brevibacterium sp. UCMA 11754]|uniref:universal stress protein n=1 Tax=Brevibacterium sp. UCMA 11754 TaxID=2749198 RepID=UPI001F34B8DB|nr:universal stress protein [Brevibacterium sp. UCMA 11754]MCF2570748.1 universal stress protein [Brevibacterium sp. UCMA 11754]